MRKHIPEKNVILRARTLSYTHRVWKQHQRKHQQLAPRSSERTQRNEIKHFSESRFLNKLINTFFTQGFAEVMAVI